MNKKICIIGLGYVGLPLAHAFSKKYQVVGFDINKPRVDELNAGFDRTLELSSVEVKESITNGMIYSTNMDDIKDCLLDLDLPFYEKQFHLIIFWMRYEDKMSAEDISKHAGVGRKYILRSIRMVKEHLKNKLKEKWNIRFSE